MVAVALQTWKLGQTVRGTPLECVALSPDRVPSEPGPASHPWILCLGGVHGDEVEGVWLLEKVRQLWTHEFPYKKVGVILWPRVNPDGVAAKQRWNANHVDLNRNLPTKDWTPEVTNPRYPPGPGAASELETRALVSLIAKVKPKAILTVHSFNEYQVNSNGPARAWADVLGKVCGYPVTEDIGYPTPGSLGTYAGVELGIPTITLEIERGLRRQKVEALHLPVVVKAIEFWEGETAQ